MSRRGVTFVEIMMVALVFVLVLALAGQALSTAGAYAFTGQLNHAVQGAALVTAELERDLLQAARDPRTGLAVQVDADGRGLAFFRVEAPDAATNLLVPVRWSLVAVPGTDACMLRRAAWDVARRKWISRVIPAVLVRPPLAVDQKTGALVTLDLTVLAREKKVAGVPGSHADGVPVRVVAAVPFAGAVARRALVRTAALEEAPR